MNEPKVVAWNIAMEGAITIGKYGGQWRKKYARGFVLVPRVYITNTDLLLLQRFQRLVGKGKIRIHTRHPKNPNHSPAWTWEICNQKDVLACLTAILPYLPSKEEQAKIVIEFLQSRLSKPQNTPYTNQEVELHNEVKNLNRRGN